VKSWSCSCSFVHCIVESIAYDCLKLQSWSEWKCCRCRSSLSSLHYWCEFLIVWFWEAWEDEEGLCAKCECWWDDEVRACQRDLRKVCGLLLCKSDGLYKIDLLCFFCLNHLYRTVSDSERVFLALHSAWNTSCCLEVLLLQTFLCAVVWGCTEVTLYNVVTVFDSVFAVFLTAKASDNYAVFWEDLTVM